jgi:hypothetical protein
VLMAVIIESAPACAGAAAKACRLELRGGVGQSASQSLIVGLPLLAWTRGLRSVHSEVAQGGSFVCVTAPDVSCAGTKRPTLGEA